MTASLNKLKTLWSPYIINLYAHVRTASHLFLFFDYCDAGTLEEYIKDKKHPMSENETV
jgi:serine/threonine protein kinase